MKTIPQRALLIRSPHIEKVLAGTKTWEIRSRSTNVRGKIGLIRSKSGTVVGTCELVDVVGPLTFQEYRRNARKAGFSPSDVSSRPYARTYAWVFKNAKRFRTPLPYNHPPGAIIWVRLTKEALRARGR